MGKVVKFTGSRLLGEELRRLRGGRTFDDIVELGRTKLISHGFKAIARGTLCDIENGKTLPNIESVFALSVLYQVPAARFIHFLLEENLAADVPAPTDEAELTNAFGDALQKAKWTDALGIAIQAQRVAQPGWQALRWKLNRALAMEMLGMRSDAISVLQECLESRDLPERERHHVHRELAAMHAAAGHNHLADMHLAEAARLLPADAPPNLKASVLQSQVQSTLEQIARGNTRPTEALMEAELARLREARLLQAADGPAKLLQLDLLEGTVYRLSRDVRRARRIYESVKERARELALPQCQADAHVMLSEIAEDDLRRVQHLIRALEIASAAEHVETSMLALARLAKYAESSEQRAYFMRRCEKIYPLLDSASPAAREYERLKADGVE